MTKNGKEQVTGVYLMGRKGEFKEIKIRSNYLNEAIKLKWYVPEGFSDLTNYHVSIMQDGDDYFQMGRIATLSDKLHEAKKINSTVFVGIHYKDRYDRQAKYHPAGEKQTDYMQFLVHEAVPFINQELPEQKAGGISLMGDSLAGTLALMTSLKHPDTFKKIVMQSPYVDEKVLEAVSNAQSLDVLSIYHTIGTEETEVETTDGDIKDFYHPNISLQRLLEEKTFHYTFHELEGKHTWKSWQNDMERVLVTMFG